MLQSDNPREKRIVRPDAGRPMDGLIPGRSADFIFGRYRQLFWVAFFVASFAILAAIRGPDSDWDLRNYHIYNAFALLHGKLGYDIAPAQLQSFFSPALDLIYYTCLWLFNTHPMLLDAVLSLPHGVGAYLAFRIALHCIDPIVPVRTALAILAALIGATGAAALPTLAGADSDMLPASLCLGGLLIMLTGMTSPRPGGAGWALAGLCFGLAAGFKLTAAPYGLGAAMGLLVLPAPSLRQWWIRLCSFGVASLLGLLLLAAPWWLKMQAMYGNPLFPLFNHVFRSPYFPPINLSDDRFRPADTLHAVFLPFYWLFNAQNHLAELPFRDPRLGVAYIATLVAGLRMMLRPRRVDAIIAMLVVFCCVAFVAWEREFSIIRYLAVLEFLSGVIVLVALRPVVALRGGRWLPWGVTIVFSLACAVLTVYPDFGHAAPSKRAVSVRVPPLASDALVVLLDDAPMAYIAAFAPPSVRFIGGNSNLIRLDQDSLLRQQAVMAIHDARGPIWGLEDPVDNPSTADKALRFYHLRRSSTCSRILSNLDGDSLRLCPLERDDI